MGYYKNSSSNDKGNIYHVTMYRRATPAAMYILEILLCDMGLSLAFI